MVCGIDNKKCKVKRRDIIKAIFGLGATAVVGFKLSEVINLCSAPPDESADDFSKILKADGFAPIYKKLDLQNIHIEALWRG